jgi:hypothetical protein
MQLTGDQRQRRQRLRGLRVVRSDLEAREQPAGVGDQRVTGGQVVPGDRWLARVCVVVRQALGGEDLTGAEPLPAYPAGRGDQLRDSVLGGDGVVEHRGVQTPAVSSP